MKEQMSSPADVSMDKKYKNVSDGFLFSSIQQTT